MSGTGDLPLTIRTGDDESVTITFSDKATGVPINIAGRTYRAQVRWAATDTAVLASYVCSITNGSGGVLSMTMSRTVTSTLTPGYAVWDLEETTTGGTVSTPLGGVVTITQDVTR